MEDVTKKLERQLAYTYRHSAFYQNKWKGLSEQDVINEFNSLPFTTKKEILKDQEDYPPYGANLSVSPDALCRIHKTSGTTNAPVLIALTSVDVQHVLDVGGACFGASGLTPAHAVMHCLNYNMWAGGFTDHQNLEKTGATVIPFGVGNTSLLIHMILRLHANAIHCTPSYLAKIEQVLDAEYNMKPRDLGLTLALLGAESGLQNADYRKSLELKWGFKAMNANYGLSEVLSMIASECEHQRGLHFRAGEKLLLELVDPVTQKWLPVCKGAIGEMVLTNLCKQAQPLIRYKTGDIAMITNMECPCNCGQPIFDIVGRTDDMMVIRGLNVFPSSISNHVLQYLPYVNGEHRILVNRQDPIDQVIVQVEKSSKNWDDTIAKKMVSTLKAELGIHIELEVLGAGELERTEGKTKRVLRVL